MSEGTGQEVGGAAGWQSKQATKGPYECNAVDTCDDDRGSGDGAGEQNAA